MWKASAIVREGRTAAAEQRPASSMQRVEDPDETALPSTTDADGFVAGDQDVGRSLGPGRLGEQMWCHRC